MRFFNKLHLKKEEGKFWSVTLPFMVGAGDYFYVIPRGFKTDLATIPFPINLWLKPDAEYKESAVFHDFLLKQMYSGSLEITRTEASRKFLNSLIYQEIDIYKIIILYSGVRLRDLYKFIQHHFQNIINNNK